MKTQFAATLRLDIYPGTVRRLRRSAEQLQHQRILDRVASQRSLWPAVDSNLGDYNTLSAKTHTDNLHTLNILSAV